MTSMIAAIWQSLDNNYLINKVAAHAVATYNQNINLINCYNDNNWS